MGATSSKHPSGKPHASTHWVIPTFGHSDETKIIFESYFMSQKSSNVSAPSTAYFLYTPRSLPLFSPPAPPQQASHNHSQNHNHNQTNQTNQTSLSNDKLVETCTPPHFHSHNFLYHRMQPFCTQHVFPKATKTSETMSTDARPSSMSVSTAPDSQPSLHHTPTTQNQSSQSDHPGSAKSDKHDKSDDNAVLLVQFFPSQQVDPTKLAKLPFTRLYTNLYSDDFHSFPIITSPAQHLFSVSFTPIQPETTAFPSLITSIFAAFNSFPFLPLVFFCVDVTNQYHINRVQAHLRSLSTLLSNNPILATTLANTSFDFFFINATQYSASSPTNFSPNPATSLSESQLKQFWTALGLPLSRLRIHQLPSIEEISGELYDFRMLLDSIITLFISQHFKTATRYILSRQDGFDEYDELHHDQERLKEEKESKKDKKDKKKNRNQSSVGTDRPSNPPTTPTSVAQAIPYFAPFAPSSSALLLQQQQFGSYYSSTTFLQKSFYRPPFPLLPPFYFKAQKPAFAPIGRTSVPAFSKPALTAPTIDSVSNIPHLDLDKYIFFGNFFYTHLFTSTVDCNQLLLARKSKSATNTTDPTTNRNDSNQINHSANNHQFHHSSFSFLNSPQPRSFCEHSYTVAISSQPPTTSQTQTFVAQRNNTFQPPPSPKHQLAPAAAAALSSPHNSSAQVNNTSVVTPAPSGYDRTESVLGDLPGFSTSMRLSILSSGQNSPQQPLSPSNMKRNLTVQLVDENSSDSDSDESDSKSPRTSVNLPPPSPLNKHSLVMKGGFGRPSTTRDVNSNFAPNATFLIDPFSHQQTNPQPDQVQPEAPFLLSSSDLIPSKKSDHDSALASNNESSQHHHDKSHQSTDHNQSAKPNKPNNGKHRNNIISELYFSVQRTKYYETMPVNHVLYEPFSISNVTHHAPPIPTNPQHSIHHVPQHVANSSHTPVTTPTSGASLSTPTTSQQFRFDTDKYPSTRGEVTQQLNINELLLQTYNITPIYSHFYDIIPSLPSILTLTPYLSTYNVFFIDFSSLSSTLSSQMLHSPPLSQTDSYSNPDNAINPNLHKLTKTEKSIGRALWDDINRAYGQLFLSPHLVCVPTLVILYGGSFENNTADLKQAESSHQGQSDAVPSQTPQSRHEIGLQNIQEYVLGKFKQSLSKLSHRQQSLWAFQSLHDDMDHLTKQSGEGSPANTQFLNILRDFEQFALVHRLDTIFQTLFQHYKTRQAQGLFSNGNE